MTTLRCGDKLLDLSRPAVMGILNATPDSFYPDSRLTGSLAESVDRAGRMIEDGARILDIGGLSTRPGAEEIPAAAEADRVLPVLEALAGAFPQAILSVDTYRSVIARQAIASGAGMINDVSGFSQDEELPEAVARGKAAYVLMHARGTPATMHQMTDYEDVVGDVLKYFVNKIRILRQAGITELVIDPGFGFAKTSVQNYTLINRLSTFRLLGYPMLVGTSRKSTLFRTIGRPAEDTLEATTALHMAALLNGANLLRVHDVRPAMDAIAVFEALRAARYLELAGPDQAP